MYTYVEFVPIDFVLRCVRLIRSHVGLSFRFSRTFDVLFRFASVGLRSVCACVFFVLLIS